MATSKKPSKGTTPKKAAARKTALEQAEKVVEKTKEAAVKHAEQLVAEESGNHSFQQVEPEKLGLRELMAEAWEAVKDKGDPSLDDCVPAHIGKLHSHAVAALNHSSAILKGDSTLARFEQEVVRLKPRYEGD